MVSAVLRSLKTSKLRIVTEQYMTDIESLDFNLALFSKSESRIPQKSSTNSVKITFGVQCLRVLSKIRIRQIRQLSDDCLK